MSVKPRKFLRRLASGLAIAAIALVGARGAWAADAAPYTDEAVRRLNHAADSIERPRPSQDPSEDLKRQMAMYGELYGKAGYSFEKSLLRFIKELSEDGMPPMVPQAAVIQDAYMAVYEGVHHGARLEAAFPPSTAASIKTLLEQLDASDQRTKRAHDEELRKEREQYRAEAAANDQRQRAAAAANEDRRRAIAADSERQKNANSAAIANAWAPSIEGRYVARGRQPGYLLLTHVAGRNFRISGEQRYSNGRSESLCQLPETDVIVDANPGILQAEGKAHDCEFSIAVRKTGSLAFTPRRCSAVCSAGVWRSERYQLSATADDEQPSRAPPRPTSDEETVQKTVNDLFRAIRR